MHNPSDTVLFARGRSIDGTVFWTGNGWSSDIIGALEIRNEEAAALALDFIRANYSGVADVDSTVGQLAIHRTTRAAVDAAYDRAMREYAEQEPLAWDAEGERV